MPSGTYKMTEEHKRKIGDGNRGKIVSDETRKKLSEAGKGEKNSRGMLGKHHSDETKKKLSEANIGKNHTEETKRKMSDNHKGMLGKHHTPESRKKIGDRNRGEKSYNYGKFREENPNWKGDDVCIESLHLRVRKTKPKPENCGICGLPEFYKHDKDRLELSNIRNHIYTDNPDDYQYIHISCHGQYDTEQGLRKKKIKKK